MCRHHAHIHYIFDLLIKILYMENYKKYLKSEIKKLLGDINASKDLSESIKFLMENSNLTQVFPNQIINALKIAIEIKSGERNIALVAPMQSGKSGTIFALCNYFLPVLGLIKQRESILFVTSMTDRDLYDQNKRNLERDFYCPVLKGHKPSHIHVVKMSNFFNHPNPHKIVHDFNVKLIVRDEDQYGCGQESSFDNAFFMTLRSKMPSIKLLAVSATPYDILDAKLKGAQVEVIEGERPESYFGISEMFEEKIIEDYPDNFKPFVFEIFKGKERKILHPKLKEYINHLKKFSDGLGVLRVSNTNLAITTRDLIKVKYNRDLECMVIGSNPSCDFKIQEGLAEVKKRVISQNKRLVLIVVHALSAGKDLRLLKSKIRFGIESRNKQLANGAQGIAGRLCGYHENRDFKILASVNLLKHYSNFEQDWEIFANENWRSDLYNLDVKGLTTQTRFKLNQRQGLFTPIENIEFFSKEDLKNLSIREKLSFIDDENFQKLKKCFESEFYNQITKGYRLNQEGVTVRIASSYNPDSNRVYKNWTSDLNSDFGSVFFKKNNYEYGVLISNYPVDDPRNKLGVTGIKIFKSGIPYMASQNTSVMSQSMYAERENIEDMSDAFMGFFESNNKVIAA